MVKGHEKSLNSAKIWVLAFTVNSAKCLTAEICGLVDWTLRLSVFQLMHHT